MIPHPRRVFSCHGDGGQRLSLGRRSAGCIGEILLFDEFGQIPLEFFVDHPSSNTTDAAAANDELLNRGR